jgi:hypothetical protein
LPNAPETTPAAEPASSSSVFHAPQLSHRPDHFAATAPQAVHTKRWEAFAILTCPLEQIAAKVHSGFCGSQSAHSMN